MTRIVLGIAVAATVSIACSQVKSGDSSSSQKQHATSVFHLVISKSPVLKTGASSIAAEYAYVARVHVPPPGRGERLQVWFFRKPISEEAVTAISRGEGRTLKESKYAVLILHLDKGGNLSQADMTYVIPGTSVARTLAWKPDDLKRYFSDYIFKENRLFLRSKGIFSDDEGGAEHLKLSWDVELNLPVIQEPTR